MIPEQLIVKCRLIMLTFDCDFPQICKKGTLDRARSTVRCHYTKMNSRLHNNICSGGGGGGDGDGHILNARSDLLLP